MRVKKTPKVVSQRSEKLSRKPKSKTVRKGRQSIKSVKAPRNKMFTDLKLEKIEENRIITRNRTVYYQTTEYVSRTNSQI